MKKIMTGMLLCTAMQYSFAQPGKKFNDTAYLKPVEVLAVRAADNAPFAKNNLTQKEIEKTNLGQDMPFILNQTPSVVVNSDAGNGVGYTGIRIRGTDATRINVTLNGIPYNDAESQGTFFVDLPDFASSVNSIQVQRGVGTSTNGAGAFGATINLSTNDINKDAYGELNNSFGSYNTWKNTIKFGSGILGKHFTVDGRLSNITSDGYIDRASTSLRSYFASAAYVSDKNSLRFNVFSGKEKTYQAWDGVPESKLKTDRTYNSAGKERPGTPYENQIDDYLQTHYQLFYNQKINTDLKANVAVFLTRGKGYYEQYKGGEALADYGLPDYNNSGTVISETDLVRRLWLDNYFYGSVFSLQYQKNKTQLSLGGGWHKYDGKHYGDVIWAQEQAAVPADYRWYNLTAYKKDYNLYSKWAQEWFAGFQTFADVQFRYVNHHINGFRNNPALFINNCYNFFNPKAGITYSKKNWQVYASYAVANREPNRDDFENVTTPKSEGLQDIEAGIERRTSRYSFSVNGYYMKYQNQLVLVGNINDVGAYTRTNVPNSYRLGVELQGKATITDFLNISGNITLSKNKIKNFTELIDDFDNGGVKTNFYKETDISFSPSVIAGGSINITPVKNAEVSFIGKYVGRQYMDNTSNESRSLNSYYVQDVRLSYAIPQSKVFESASIILQLNNVLNKKYEANGYTFSYIYGGMATENFYFPMATFNWTVGVNIRF